MKNIMTVVVFFLKEVLARELQVFFRFPLEKNGSIRLDKLAQGANVLNPVIQYPCGLPFVLVDDLLVVDGRGDNRDGAGHIIVLEPTMFKYMYCM